MAAGKVLGNSGDLSSRERNSFLSLLFLWLVINSLSRRRAARITFNDVYLNNCIPHSPNDLRRPLALLRVLPELFFFSVYFPPAALINNGAVGRGARFCHLAFPAQQPGSLLFREQITAALEYAWREISRATPAVATIAVVAVTGLDSIIQQKRRAPLLLASLVSAHAA